MLISVFTIQILITGIPAALHRGAAIMTESASNSRRAPCALVAGGLFYSESEAV